MKLYIGRTPVIYTEDNEHYLERHPEDEKTYTKLLLFYECPTEFSVDDKDNVRANARIMAELPSYMCPEIECGEIASLLLIDNAYKKNSNISKELSVDTLYWNIFKNCGIYVIPKKEIDKDGDTVYSFKIFNCTEPDKSLFESTYFVNYQTFTNTMFKELLKIAINV